MEEVEEIKQKEKQPAEKIAEATEDIFETYRKLMTINLVEYTSLGASASVVGIVYLIFIVFSLLFVGLGAAWWLGETLDNMKAGFFIVAGVCVGLLILMLLTTKRKLIPIIRNMIIKEIYDQD